MKIKTEYLNMSENNIYGLTDSDHGFFGGASNEDVPSSDDSQISHHQPFPLPGQCFVFVEKLNEVCTF